MRPLLTLKVVVFESVHEHQCSRGTTAFMDVRPRIVAQQAATGVDRLLWRYDFLLRSAAGWRLNGTRETEVESMNEYIGSKTNDVALTSPAPGLLGSFVYP